MRNKIKIIFAAFMLITFISQAQIGLNTETYFGNANLGLNHRAFNGYSGNVYNADFNPGYGKFIGNKTLLSIQPQAQYSKYDYKNNSSSEKYNGADSKIGLYASLRHYLNPSSKFKFYGEASIAIESQSFNGNDGTFNYKSSNADFGVAVGANYFLNKTIAIKGQLGYNRTQDLSSRNSLFNISANDYFIGLSLENFTSVESEVGEGAELIAKGRKSIGGNIGVNINSYGTLYQLRTQYSQFIANGLMIGGQLEYFRNSRFSQLLNIQSNIRYYIPIGKKLFIYPEAKIGYADTKPFNSSSNGRFYYELGVGMNYFIKKNVALEIDLFRLSGTKGETNTFIGGNVGLKYFLK